MSGDPWSDPDPQPGDFDASIEAGEVAVAHFPADPTRQLVRIVELRRRAQLTTIRSQDGEDVLEVSLEGRTLGWITASVDGDVVAQFHAERPPRRCLNEVEALDVLLLGPEAVHPSRHPPAQDPQPWEPARYGRRALTSAAGRRPPASRRARHWNV